MKDNFSIEVPNTKAKSYQYINTFLLLMNVLMFAYFFIGSSTVLLKSIAAIGLLLNLLSVVLQVYQTKNKITFRYNVLYTLFISALLWLILGNIFIAVVLVVLGFLGVYANKKLLIHFHRNGIVYPSFPEKQFAWDLVTQAMIKDDILTIDLNNNHLMQFNLAAGTIDDAESSAFNEFCKACVDASNSAME